MLKTMRDPQPRADFTIARICTYIDDVTNQVQMVM